MPGPIFANCSPKGKVTSITVCQEEIVHWRKRMSDLVTQAIFHQREDRQELTAVFRFQAEKILLIK